MISVRGLPDGARRAYSRRISTFFAVPRSPALLELPPGDRGSSSTSSGRAVTSAPGSSPSSLISGW